MIKKAIAVFSTVIIIALCQINTALAHPLAGWADYYEPENATNENAFGFYNAKHINGKNVRYRFGSTNAENYFGEAVENAFENMWDGIVTGTEVDSYSDANVNIYYESLLQPANSMASTSVKLAGPGSDYHYGTGLNGTAIYVYRDAKDYPTQSKTIIMAHEFGHVWGIADLYEYTRTLPGMYSNTYGYTAATRHDRNAMRISLNNLWYNPGSSQIWEYQSSPGVFNLRGDPDGDGEISVTDARLVLRYAIGSEEPSAIQSAVSDVDGDGEITVEDARLVLRVAILLETRFPADVDE